VAEKTGIEWTDATWNPVRGCSRVSEGCRYCYAEAVAARFSGPGLPYEGLAADGKWTGKVKLIEKHLADPLRWTKPRRIFVNSMSDLFHEGLSDEEIAVIFGVMASARRHTFQILTKRPARMLEWFRSFERDRPDSLAVIREFNRTHEQQIDEDQADASALFGIASKVMGNEAVYEGHDILRLPTGWPLPNVWLGVSVEDQKTVDERIPLLLQTPAAVRFVSYEPALGKVDFTRIGVGTSCEIDALQGGANVLHDATLPREAIKIDGLDWVIVGGESGSKARPFDVAWARRIVKDCATAGVACFVKQLGARPRGAQRISEASVFHGDLTLKDRKGGDMAEWPEDLQVRQFPEAR
jgi:protein gp37